MVSGAWRIGTEVGPPASAQLLAVPESHRQQVVAAVLQRAALASAVLTPQLLCLVLPPALPFLLKLLSGAHPITKRTGPTWRRRPGGWSVRRRHRA